MSQREGVDATEVLTTADGPMRMDVFRPSSGPGPWPAVLFCIDGLGPRPSLQAMARRIADAGYLVVLPDLFHRAGSLLDVLPPDLPREHKSFWAMFSRPEARTAWKARFYDPAVDRENLRKDFGAVFAWLDAQRDARPGGVGTTGYCMGGNVSLRLAALFPGRVKACASFHGGNLATDAPDSPHLGAPEIKARVYVGAASEDPSFPEAMKAKLEAALREAGVDHAIETYAGRHGFAVPDAPVFDAACAERHYQALFDLLACTLGH